MVRRIRWLGILALALAPAGGNSLGLGDIKLNSFLNERLDAEIVLSLSAADDLGTLRVGIAPVGEFDRVGIDRPVFLDDIDFAVERTSPRAARLRVTSTQPIVEPFVTFLIEAEWTGGRLIREYTVLLDPPTFLQMPEAPAVAAPQPATESPTTGVVRQPAPGPVVRTEPTTPPIGAMPTRYGPVRRAETLWSIAEALRPDESVSVNQVMLALFRANPDAFDGNINRMRAGSILQVPSREDITGVPRGEATAEVRRQNTRWRGEAATGPAAGRVATDQGAVERPVPTDEPRLELVPPADETVVGDRVAAPPAQYVAEQEALNQELLTAVQSLRRELEETRQSISIKDAEIAALQSRLAQIEDSRGVVPPEPTTAPDAPSPEGTVAGGDRPPTGTAPAAQTPAVAADGPAPSARPTAGTPAPATSPPAAGITRPSTEGGGLFSSLWLWIVAAVVVLSGLFLVWKRRQESETDTYEAWTPTPAPETAAAEPAIVVEEGPRHAPAPAPSRAPAPPPARKPEIETAAPVEFEEDSAQTLADQTGILSALAPDTAHSEESAAPLAEATGTDYQYPFEDTIAGATGINLEQSDPLAEADFHMAYGLYDQAADLIHKAIDREPDRHDLRLKMLDILFVWGKKDEFVAAVQALKDRGGVQPSDWTRVAIMGRQIAPDEAIFEGDGATMTLDHTVAGEERSSGLTAIGGALDFDLAGDPGSSQVAEVDSDVLDFDLGATGELPGPGAAARGRRDEVAPDQTAELEIEDLGLDLDLESLTAENEIAGAPSNEDETLAQTMEAAPGQGTDAMAETVEVPRSGAPGATADTMEAPRPDSDERTGITEMIKQAEELLLDEESADTGVLVDDGSDTGILKNENSDTEVLRKSDQAEGETGITEMLEELDEDGGGDDFSDVFAADDLQTDFDSGDESTVARPSPVAEDTAELRAVLEDESGELIASDGGGTDMLPAPGMEDVGDTAQIEAMADEDPDLDLDDLTRALGVDLEPTAEMPAAGEAPDGDTLIAEVFGDDVETRVAPARDVLMDRDDDATREIPRIDTSDVTLSEVGTKLDLARAYIDMGDPDGARSILEEVIEEGNDTQKGEAQDLLQGIA